MRKLRKFRWLALGLAVFLSVNLLSVGLPQGVQSKLPPTPTQTPGSVWNNSNLPSLEEVLQLAQGSDADRLQRLAEGDRLYRNGNISGAENVYREVKPSYSGIVGSNSELPEPVYDADQLGGAARVYWREAQAGFEQNMESRLFIALEMLVEDYPQFIPGHLLLVDALKQYDREDEAIEVLERAATLYPNEPGLIAAEIQALADDKQWLEASISARQFALLFPEDEKAADFTKLADKYLGKYQSGMKRKLIGQAILSGVINVGDYLLTGNAAGGIPTLQLTMLLLQGESSFGNQFSEAYKQEFRNQGVLVEDPQILEYVDRLGQQVAALMGRDEFDYEFNVIANDALNAFAMPGGKVFIHTGALMQLETEAELMGLLGHEVGHAVLSHGYQRIAKGTLLSNLNRVLPLGDVIAELLNRAYSRQHERQADILGTRVLAGTKYAADGVRNVMVRLDKLYGDKAPPPWLSTHPPSAERVRYLEEMIVENSYNPYAYEGVSELSTIQARVQELFPEES
jgi:Zn-dependent protease with chaperone function